MAQQASQAAVDTHDAPRRPRVAAAVAAEDEEADADDDEDSEDVDPQQQTIKEGGVMIPQELYDTLPRAFQIGWEALSGPQQQKIIMASHSIRVNNIEEEEEGIAHDAQRRPRVAAAAAAKDEEEDYEIIGRALLTREEFDPEDIHKTNDHGWTPMRYFCRRGNLKMCRYLIGRRGADCRKVDRDGSSPLFVAAMSGHLEVMQFLCHECGAHEDVQKGNRFAWFPLSIALRYEHFDVVWWLLLKGALAPRDDVDGGGIDDEIMRRDLRQGRSWRDDQRLPLLLRAQDVVTDHDNFQLVLTGTILFPDDEVPEIFELIAQYVGGTPQQLHTLRQLIDSLGEFIDDVRFVIRGEEDADADEEDE